MISETVVELCAVVSELAAERDVYRRKADRIGEQRAVFEENGADICEMRRALDRRGEAIEALETERDALRTELDALKAGKAADLAVGDLARSLFDAYDQTVFWSELSDEERETWRGVASTAIRRLCGHTDSRLAWTGDRPPTEAT